jgi:hypothetical protein
MTTKSRAGAASGGASDRVAEAILALVATAPSTREPRSAAPRDRAREIAASASLRAAGVAGGLALPPGPLGWVTILPELIVVWRIQAQMAADIAGAFGHSGALTREQMIWCLFRHAAAQAVRDLVVRAGERWLVRRATAAALQAAARKIGVSVTQRAVGKGISRFLPLVGAVGVAWYAWYDTGKVADTAIELFERGIDAPG